MKVELLSWTQSPELVCAKAMRGCRSKLPAYDIPMRSNDIERMIKSAIRLRHLSVLEHASFTFSVKRISRACTHQLVRHRIASYSQQSGRIIRPEYIIMPLSVYNSKYRNRFLEYSNNIIGFFNEMCDSSIPMDDARYILPFGHESNIVLTMNARELRHFFKLRIAKDAHWEIKQLANMMLTIVYSISPLIFEDIYHKNKEVKESE